MFLAHKILNGKIFQICGFVFDVPPRLSPLPTLLLAFYIWLLLLSIKHVSFGEVHNI